VTGYNIEGEVVRVTQPPLVSGGQPLVTTNGSEKVAGTVLLRCG